MSGRYLSVIIPTLNEEGNIKNLISRIDAALRSEGITYEIIFVDDHSVDKTRDIIAEHMADYPISVYLKAGKQGKAFSIIQGLAYARYGYIAYIDADLQYPPESLPAMLAEVENNVDICVANRAQRTESWHRNFISKAFSSVIMRWLHGFDLDVQAGMKVFKRQIAEEIKICPSPWTIDLELLIKARNYGYKIGGLDIHFAKRDAGVSKLPVKNAILEIGLNALKLRFRKIPPLAIAPSGEAGMTGAGLADERQRFITHTTLSDDLSAIRTFAGWQKYLLIALVLIIGFGLISRPLAAGAVLVGILSVFYFIDMLFHLFIVLRSLKNKPEITVSREELHGLEDGDLPVYSILCPLFRESRILPIFLDAIDKINWPKDKLDVILLLEENDPETIWAARSQPLPDYVRTIIVPNSQPKTKPKACNYGLNFARGEYIVVYDAEDAPDPWQLKKIYLGFQKSPESVRCIQAKLNYYNPHQNLLTKLFTAEYSLWFDVTLPGLQSINTVIPLGGTSNHFYTGDLVKLKGWDPFNVTEDCDLGVRIFNAGYRTAIINSVTLEEANSSLKNWLRQRSRWIKGYMQTYLVNMRRPASFFRKNGVHACIFQLVVGAKIAFLFINPLLWVATASYFSWRATVGPSIEALYPSVIFYLATASLIFGNFVYLYCYMIGCAKRGHWELVKYIFLVPFYWLMMSAAAVVSIYQLFVKPYFWEKTEHGLHLPEAVLRTAPEPAGETVLAPESRPAFAEKIIALAGWQAISSPAGFLILAVTFSNMINFVFSVWLGRVLDFEALGLVIFINTVWYVVMIFATSFGMTINHQGAYLSGAGNAQASLAFRSSMVLKGLRISLSFALLWLLLSPFLSAFFHISNHLILLAVAPIFPFGLIVYANVGFFEGILKFRSAALILMLEAIAKLAFAGLFVFIGLEEWVFASIPAAVTAASLFSILLIRRKTASVRIKQKFPFPGKFFASSLLASLSSVSFLTFDIILAKHFLEPAAAGQYALLSLVGKIIYFGASLPNFLMITYVSRNQGIGRDSGYVLKRIFLATLILAAAGVAVFGYYGRFTAAFFFGAKIGAVSRYLPDYALAISLFTLSNVIVSYRLALKNYSYSVASFMFSVLLSVGILFFHASIADFVNMIMLASLASFAAVGTMHLSQEWADIIKRNIEDFVGLFYGRIITGAPPAAGKMRILIFNWRDMRHVYAGGAEKYIQKIAEKWVIQGNQATIFSGNDGFSSFNEIVNGVAIVRRGGFYFVYLWACLYYFIYFRSRYDLIIDCHNGIPFFTPCYAKEPVYCLMHHVHQEVFRRSLIKPLAWIALFLEKALMPLVYRRVKFITVSESSRKEIYDLGLGRMGISIVNPGVDLDFLRPGEKSPYPLILYLGRLKKYKSIDILIKAFNVVLAEVPEARLVIAGSGEEKERLEKLAANLQLSSKVSFAGKVTEEEKLSLLQRAWVTVNPSFMEGWGITTTESNACGTPVVASNVPGLVDSVVNPHTGLLAEYGNIADFAEKIKSILADQGLRNRMSLFAVLRAQNFNWEKCSEDFYSLINYKVP